MIISINDFIDVINTALAGGEVFVLPLKGDSMLPFFKTGDQAILDAPSKIKRLDVILYQRDNKQYVFHRIIKVKHDYYLVTGDNQTILEKVDSKMIIAKMVGYIKKDKIYTGKSLWYRVKVFIWAIIPLRKIIFKLRRIGRKKNA